MGKEKEQYPKITKKLLDFLDEEEKNREVTFQSFDVFGRVYTESSVIGRIEDDLRRIPSLVNRYKYLSKAKSHINKMKHNSYLKEELIDKELSNFNNKKLDMVDAYFPIKVWIEKQYDQIEKEIEKEKSNKEKKKQLKDLQTTFEINKKYSHLLNDMWELMKAYKSNMIDYDTKFEDFEKIFTVVAEKEITKPIHWIGKKATLLRLFDDLMQNKILTPKTLGWNSNNKHTHPLDICFVKDSKGTNFLKWKSSYAHLEDRTTTNQETIDKIINLFKPDTK